MLRRRLVAESLEGRLLLAGNVTAQLSGGWLVVNGDDLGNEVRIAELGGGTYDVVGIGDTTVIGDGPFTSSKGIKVDLKKGDDLLEVVGDPDPFAVKGGLSIKMGDGEDAVALTSGAVSGATTVDLGKGPGDLSIDDVQFAKDLTVKAGDAPGTEEPWVSISINRSSVTGNLAVTTGKTRDLIELAGVTVTKNVTIKTRDGEDYAGVSEGYDDEFEEYPSLIGGKLSIDIGNGGGEIWLGESTVKKDVSLKAGMVPVATDAEPYGSSNGASIWAATVEGKLTVKMGKGDAWVDFCETTVNKDASITTNNGNDELVFYPEYTGEEGETDGDGLSNVFGGKLTVNSGSGNDYVAMASAQVTGVLDVKTGDGDDTVGLLELAVGSKVSISTGNHNDQIGIAGLQAAGNVTVNSGNAATGKGDQVLITDSDFAKNLSVTTGNGHDAVGIGASEEVDAALAAFLADYGWELGIKAGMVTVDGKATVATGKGSDSLSIGLCDVAGAASIDTSSGADQCEILDTTVGGNVSVKMGADNDQLGIWDSGVTGNVTLDGGAGDSDILGQDNNTFVKTPVIKKFETVI